MSKLTMRQFVKSIAKRNGIKLRQRVVQMTDGHRYKFHEADEIHPEPNHLGFVTPDTAESAIASYLVSRI